jgi:hypothetical protein
MTAPNPPFPYGALTAPIPLASVSFAQSSNAILATLNDAAVTNLLAVASSQIEKICKRTFGLTQYQSYLSGGGQPYDLIRLDNFPVSQITRMASLPLAVLTIRQTNTTTYQRATVDTQSIASSPQGLNLTTVASGVYNTVNLPYATYPTLQDLANAITALNQGWVVTISPTYALWPSADLRPLQGAVSCIYASGAQLELYTEDITAWAGPWFDSGQDYGLVCSGPGWRLDPDTGHLIGWFPSGQYNIRVDYSAGFASTSDGLPFDIQQACVLEALFLYQSGTFDPTTVTEKIGPYTKTSANELPSIPPNVLALIKPYIDRSKALGWFKP